MNKSSASNKLNCRDTIIKQKLKMKPGLSISGFILTISIIILTSCGTYFQDAEGNKSKIVKIGSQEWTAKNLNLSHFRNGESIPEVKSVKEWELAGLEGKPACCYFEDKPENGVKYGRLYNWYALNDPRGLVPEGWHIPDGAEWTQLIMNLGGDSVSVVKMKAKSGWDADCNGNSSSGFSGLPGGYRHYSGVFNRYDSSGGAYWWDSAEGFIYMTCSYPIYQSTGGENGSFTSKARGFSVRLIKD